MAADRESGTEGSPLELKEVIFGMKCKESAKFTIMKALEKWKGSVAFYAMCEERGTFNLRKDEMDSGGELFAHFPQRHLDLLEGFEDLTGLDTETGVE